MNVSIALKLEELRREVQCGLDSVASGKFTEYDRASVMSIADQVKETGRSRKQPEKKSAKANK